MACRYANACAYQRTWARSTGSRSVHASTSNCRRSIMLPRPDDLTDDDEVIINSLVVTFTARQLAEELMRRCGCAFYHRLPKGAPPAYECDYHRRQREGHD